jgi:hypothetical protein
MIVSDDSLLYADQMMTYQNMRGGKVRAQNIPLPEADGSIQFLLKSAYELEKQSYEALLFLLDIGKNDYHLTGWIQSRFLEKKMKK